MCLADFCDILRCSAQVKAKASQFCFACLNYSAFWPPIELDCSFAVWIVRSHKIICSVNRLAEDLGQLVSHQGATATRSSLQDKDKYKSKEKDRDRETETAVGILKMINFEGGPRSQ